jgi:hypothetical protein
MIREGPFEDEDKAMIEEDADELKTRWKSDVLGHEKKLMEQKHDVLPLRIHRRIGRSCERRAIPSGRMERRKSTVKEVFIRLDVLDDVGLVVEDEGVENIEGRVFERAREDDIFEVLKAVGLVDLLSDGGVFDLDGLSEAGGVGDELSMRGFELGEFGVVYE